MLKKGRENRAERCADRLARQSFACSVSVFTWSADPATGFLQTVVLDARHNYPRLAGLRFESMGDFLSTPVDQVP